MEKLRELLTVLEKDEETLRNTILNANGQLQYNRKLQEAIKQELVEKEKKSKTTRRKK